MSGVGVGTGAWRRSRARRRMPPLPLGFSYVQNADGAYEVWPDGAYVVEYTG